MKDIAEQFSNYAAFTCHFEPIHIEKVGRDDYIAYYEEKTFDGGYRYPNVIHRGTKEYTNGWLYGAVQGILRLRRKENEYV